MNSPVTQTAPPQESSFWDELFGNSPVENNSAAVATSSQANFDSANSDSANSASANSDFFNLENFTAPLRWARQFFSDEASQSSFVDSFPNFEPPPEFSLSYYYDYTKRAVQYTLDSGEKFLLGTPSSAGLVNQPGLMNQAPTRTYPYSLTPAPKAIPEAKSIQSHQQVDLIPIVPVFSIPIWINSSLTDFDYFSYTPKRAATEIIDDEIVIPILAEAPVPSQLVTEEIFQPSVVIPVFVKETDPVSNLVFDSVFDAEENLQSDLNQTGSLVRTIVSEPRKDGASLITLPVFVPTPVTEGGTKALSELATGHHRSRKTGTPALVEKSIVDFSRAFSVDEITALSHQSTIVELSSPLIFDFSSVGSEGRFIDGNEGDAGRVILLPEISSSVILSAAMPLSAILSPAMLALNHCEERTVAVALISGFVYIHGGMVSLFSSRDEWSGRVTDTLHAERRAHVLATVSAGSRSGQEDRQQKQGQDNSALYQLLTSA